MRSGSNPTVRARPSRSAFRPRRPEAQEHSRPRPFGVDRIRSWWRTSNRRISSGATRSGRFLQGAAFPADRDALLRSAEELQATEDVLDMLRSLPSDKTYENLQEVW
ncbi:MAG: DUF2795 domain-containing protein, partial [Actinomycetota bacterium]